MPRPARLRRPEQFARVRRDGKTWAHPYFILNAARNRAGRSRAGFVVPKRFGKAHERNLAKRRMSEAIRLLWTYIVPGWDVVLVVRAPVLTVAFHDLERALADMLRRAHLWVTPLEQEATHVTPDRPGDHSPISTLLTPDTS
ncbi:MAG: ribonuclease P protein component [Herpetosiphonaceae bacterium]|nr:ribonuclease P protein component [Herpetosiphonaceae bacterium]